MDHENYHREILVWEAHRDVHYELPYQERFLKRTLLGVDLHLPLLAKGGVKIQTYAFCYATALGEPPAVQAIADIEKVLQMKIVGKIPTDEEVALSSVNDGVPIIQKKSKHPISKAISDLVEEVDFLIQTEKSENPVDENIEVSDDYFMPN